MLLINKFPTVTKLSSRTECDIPQNTYVFCGMSRQVQAVYAIYIYIYTYIYKQSRYRPRGFQEVKVP